jgi:hypothetical protein
VLSRDELQRTSRGCDYRLFVEQEIPPREDWFEIDIHDEGAAEILTVEQMIDYVTVALAMKETVRSRSNTQRTVGLR